MSRFEKIPIDKIRKDERIREELDISKPFLSSIRVCGLLHPITVVEEDDGWFLLLAGERRLEGCRELGWEQIYANIHSQSEMETENEH